MSFGENLKTAIYEKGITPKSLCQFCGVSESAMEKFMNDLMYPSVPLFALMAEQLGVSMDWLFGGKGTGE